MKLIVGLGNPGNRYNFTRHNFGFLALDFWCKKRGIEWEKHEKNGAIYAKDGGLILIKPQTFYNEVGQSVLAWKQFYKLDSGDILVVCDDFNLGFETIRRRERGSAGGNNGLKSIIASLGTEDFARLRLGTGNDELRAKIGDVDFVLSKFTKEEKEKLPAILNEAFLEIEKLT